jgi:hypothetical protein
MGRKSTSVKIQKNETVFKNTVEKNAGNIIGYEKFGCWIRFRTVVREHS